MDVKLYIGGVERTDLVVRTVRASYVRPWEATIKNLNRGSGE